MNSGMIIRTRMVIFILRNVLLLVSKPTFKISPFTNFTNLLLFQIRLAFIEYPSYWHLR